MIKSKYEFEVIIHGKAAREYFHNGSNYIEGKEGTGFSLRMRNNSNHKALFVPTVDGLSIMSGKEGSFESSGYIVPAYDSVTIDGWRTSSSKVAEFFFASQKNSYASKIDKGGNLGVIGCAVFKEKDGTLYLHSVANFVPQSFGGSNNMLDYSSATFHTSTASLNTRGALTKASASLGTGFGQEKTSHVSKVSFDREETPEAVFTIFYNTRKKLEELGIEFNKAIYVAPSAFPAEEGYCKKPY